MKPLNVLIMQGRLGREPEIRYCKNGSQVVNTSIAMSRGKDKGAEFFDVISYDTKVIEDLTKYFHKGFEIIIHGSLHLNEWTDKNGSKHKNPEIWAENFSFVSSGKKRDDEPSDSDDSDLTYTPAAAPEPLDSADGELPF